MNNEPYRRPDRVAQQILQIIGEIATKYIDLSYLGFITFSKVLLSNDLKYAKVFYSVIQPRYSQAELNEKLNHQASVFRKHLGAEMRIKHTPEIKFIHDESFEYAEKMNRLISQVIPDDTADDTDAE